MYAFESAKSRFETLTGWAQPRPGEIIKRIKKAKPRATVFKDSNLIPNNPTLPFLHYRKVVSLTGLADPAALFERLFKTNGWMDAWRNGVYDYVHYHPRTHEVLGIARGHARVRFGGKKGERLMSGQAMSSFCQQAPAIRLSERARIFWWSALIRAPENMTSTKANARNTKKPCG